MMLKKKKKYIEKKKYQLKRLRVEKLKKMD